MLQTVRFWLLAFRPKTLTAAVIPVVVGSCVVKAIDGHVDIALAVYALFSALCIQVATNLLNDAIDFKKGTDRADRIGPQRITQSGKVSVETVLFAGYLFLVFALLAGIPLALSGGLPILLLGVVSMFMAYSYTGGPFPLAYLGLGDLFVLLFFGLFAVGGMEIVFTRHVSLTGVVAGLQIGFLATVIIAINNLRDINQDKISKKNTLAVRFGKTFVRYEIATLLLLSYGFGLFWLYERMIAPAVLPLVTFPLGLKVARAVFTNEPSPAFNRFLGQAAGVHMFFGLLLGLGLWMS